MIQRFIALLLASIVLSACATYVYVYQDVQSKRYGGFESIVPYHIGDTLQWLPSGQRWVIYFNALKEKKKL